MKLKIITTILQLRNIFALTAYLLIHGTYSIAQNNIFPYQNPNLPIETRVQDLLCRMTIKEKVAQLECREFRSIPIIEEIPVVGHLGYTRIKTNRTPKEETEYVNSYQKSLISRSRLGIPAIIHTEALHGLAAKTATIFPQAIGLASTWDTDLMREVSSVIADETKSRGYHQVLSPMINIARDARWGRVQETYGEDPFLTSEMAVAFCKSFEEKGIITTPKAFAANVGDGGRDSYAVHISEQLLREMYFPAFKNCIQKAGSRSLMTAYNSLNGAPCSSNRWLLFDILRKEWGFKGFVVSDYYAPQWILEKHQIAENKETTAALCLNAGMDVELPEFGIYGQSLEKSLTKGLVETTQLDWAVANVLKAKFELGLFENPYGDPDKAQRLCDSKEHRELAKKAALKSLILLKNNNNTLPLKNSIKTIGVVGPGAYLHETGDYSGFGVKVVNILDGIRAVVSPDVKIVFEPIYTINNTFLHQITSEHFTTVNGYRKVKGVRMEIFSNTLFKDTPVETKYISQIDNEHVWKEIPETITTLANGFSFRLTTNIIAPKTQKTRFNLFSCDICPARLFVNGKLTLDYGDGRKRSDNQRFFIDMVKGNTYEIIIEYASQPESVRRIGLQWEYEPDYKAAINLAKTKLKDSDVIIFVSHTGEKEGKDRAILNLPYPQEDIISAFEDIDARKVMVLVNGGPVVMDKWIDKVDAILETWYSGSEGGNAIAETLFGIYNPGGKLPITFPLNVGQCPIYYNYKPSGRSYDYKDIPGTPLFPFGFGLSYTNFKFSNLEIVKNEIDVGESQEVSVYVTNTGKFPGDEVVQLYLNDVVATLVQPLKELKGFERVTLNPGESKKITFRLTPDDLSMWNNEMKFVQEKGYFDVMIGSSSEDIKLTGRFTVK